MGVSDFLGSWVGSGSQMSMIAIAPDYIMLSYVAE